MQETDTFTTFSEMTMLLGDRLFIQHERTKKKKIGANQIHETQTCIQLRTKLSVGANLAEQVKYHSVIHKSHFEADPQQKLPV